MLEEILSALIDAWCWLLIVASPTLLAAILAVLAFVFAGPIVGVLATIVLLPAGVVTGIKWAEYARRKDMLVEFSHGLPPPKRREDAAGGREQPSSPQDR